MMSAVLCQTCLSSERLLYPVKYLENLIKDINIFHLCVIPKEGGICWECKAIMCRFSKFKKQVRTAQDILAKSSQTRNCLSRLSNHNKDIDYHFNYDDPLYNNIKFEVKSNIKQEDITNLQYDSDVNSDESDDSESKNIKVHIETDDSESKNIAVHIETDNSRKKRKKQLDCVTTINKSNVDIKTCDEDFKEKFTTVIFSEEEMVQNREEKRNHPNFKKIPYKCDLCVLGFTRKDTYILHVKRKHDKTMGEYMCDVCQIRFPSEPNVTRHRQTHFTRHRCKLCKYETALLRVALAHCRDKHSADTCGVIHCSQCNVTAATPEEMTEHKIKHHSLNCNECGEKFKSKNSLRSHKIRIHKQKREFICDICNKALKTKSRLESHIVTHNSTIAESLAYCTVCKVQYKNLYVYRSHLRNSTNHSERTYQCVDCNKKFASKVYLRKHRDFYHLHKSQYKCETCDKLFISNWRLKNHRQKHHGLSRSRDHPCDICRKEFYTLATLRAHQLTHSEHRPYMCEDCGDTFKQRPALYTHSRLVHKGFKRRKKNID